jgi:hypothetical protein
VHLHDEQFFHSRCNARAYFLYLIIKELRFLPKFSSNFLLDRFTLPLNHIILSLPCNGSFIFLIVHMPMKARSLWEACARLVARPWQGGLPGLLSPVRPPGSRSRAIVLLVHFSEHATTGLFFVKILRCSLTREYFVSIVPPRSYKTNSTDLYAQILWVITS